MLEIERRKLRLLSPMSQKRSFLIVVMTILHA
jgi:hypothetical protein